MRRSRGLLSRVPVLLLALALALTGFVGCDPDATYTIVYIVRHAEVDYSTHPTNPSLTAAGQVRAQALAERFEDIDLAAVYQTQYTRTRQTAAPVAQAKGLTPTELPDNQTQQLVDHVLANHSGATVLLVNHSHTALDVISRFGADPPFPEYPGDEFDKLFVLIHSASPSGASAGVFVAEYGLPSP